MVISGTRYSRVFPEVGMLSVNRICETILGSSDIVALSRLRIRAVFFDVGRESRK